MLDLNFDPFPVLTTERLVLRKMTPADGPEMLFLRSDEEVMRYIARPRVKNVEEAIEFINRVNTGPDTTESITWAITLHGSDTLIGNVGLWRIQKDNHRAELGYVLHPVHYGKGIMSEAVAAVLDYSFTVMLLHSVEGRIHPDNIASGKVLERAGFVQEALFRESMFWDGKFIDSAAYSLITPLK